MFVRFFRLYEVHASIDSVTTGSMVDVRLHKKHIELWVGKFYLVASRQ